MDPPQSFSEKVLLITGAGSGIGKATSVKLAALGACLALCDIDEASVNTTAAMCAQDPATQPHMSRAFDVGDTAAVDAFVAAIAERYGAIDHVFNCAGVNPTAMALESTPDEYWTRLVNTNLKGTFNVTRACIPHLRSGSSFVNVASIAASRPAAGMAVYSMTKAGIIAFSKAMAMELGPRGIRTNVVAPGDVHTPTNASVVSGKEALKASVEKVALGRLGEADEVADAVIFLFGEGSQYINGSVVEVNGGIM